MIIELRHEVHGVHHAYTEFEAENCEKNGWVRVLEAPVSNSRIENKLTLREQYEKKFGKPPHHRMLDETIQAKLEED
mgnify:CR=1 FL=1